MTEEVTKPTEAPVPGTPPDPERVKSAFAALVDVVARLRSPTGCPWDRAQTLATIKPYTLEETYEVFEAIDTGDVDGLVEELGDLLLQVVLYAQIAADDGKFDLVPVLDGITDKMLRRHPHVFGETSLESAEQVLHHWDRAKQQEKLRNSALDGVPLALPALARAARLTAKGARVGYDLSDVSLWWRRLRQVEVKLASLLTAPEGLASPSDADSVSEMPHKPDLESQFGELLFVVANLARKAGVNPEDALQKRNRQFDAQFRRIEDQVRTEQGQSLGDLPPATVRALYEQQESGA